MLATSCLLSLLPSLISGHGSLVEPPARATMADHGFPENPHDSNWMEGFCGGKVEWSSGHKDKAQGNPQGVFLMFLCVFMA